MNTLEKWFYIAVITWVVVDLGVDLFSFHANVLKMALSAS